MSDTKNNETELARRLEGRYFDNTEEIKRIGMAAIFNAEGKIPISKIATQIIEEKKDDPEFFIALAFEEICACLRATIDGEKFVGTAPTPQAAVRAEAINTVLDKAVIDVG